jgi:ABC-type transport system involved in multi-copper enzyme maturation permease subunit
MADAPMPSSAAFQPRPVPAAPTFVQGALRVFDLSVGQMLWSRRTIFMALVVGLPVVVSVVLRLLFEAGVPVTRVGRTTLSGPFVFGLMIWAFFIRFSIPVLAVFYGTALIADEVEDKTITYLFTRPISRGAVLVGKYLAYLVATVSVVLPAVVLVWLLIAPVGADLGSSFLDLTKDLGMLVAGLAAYGAVFALAGARLKRPLLFGLLFVFGWENLVMVLPGYLKQLTVAYYLQGLVPHAIPADSTVQVLQNIFQILPGLTESVIGLTVITGLCVWVAARTVTVREYVLEQ